MEVYNLQRKVQLDAQILREFVKKMPEHVHETLGRSFAIALVSDRRIMELNSLFRNKDATTDVLSFPHEPDEFEPEGDPFLGDIVISAEQAQKQAGENGLSLEGEIKQLILHGLLHLCGYDHETDNGEMNKRELELRSQLNV